MTFWLLVVFLHAPETPLGVKTPPAAWSQAGRPEGALQGKDGRPQIFATHRECLEAGVRLSPAIRAAEGKNFAHLSCVRVDEGTGKYTVEHDDFGGMDS